MGHIVKIKKPRAKSKRPHGVIPDEKDVFYTHVQYTVTMSLRDEAKVLKALEIVRNHFADDFLPKEMKTLQMFIRTIGIRFSDEIIETWERMKKEAKR